MPKIHLASVDEGILVHPDLPNGAPLVTAKEVHAVIRSFKPGSFGGPGGPTPQHLKDLVADSKNLATAELCEALADKVNVMLKVTCRLRTLYGANLSSPGNVARLCVG